MDGEELKLYFDYEGAFAYLALEPALALPRAVTRLAQAWPLAVLVALIAAPAGAHGPTVEVSFSELRPTYLVIAAGETVHFRPSGAPQISLTIVADGGQFESPVLGAAGWHYTFDTPGEFPVHLKENSAARARILVGEPRPADPEPVEDEHAGHAH